MTRIERCVCGAYITADDADPASVERAVSRHNRGVTHQGWRRGRHQCAGAGGSVCPVTVPADRELCFYCTRTLAMVAA
jgi:hypothetical protein